MLCYLRIQADSFADLVQYFYRPELSSFPSGNFGELAKSVPTIDSANRAIILANRKWFDVLAGDDGLRDVITHQGEMIGVSWEKQVDQPANRICRCIESLVSLRRTYSTQLKESLQDGLASSMKLTGILSLNSRT